jgi:hypothetical protein
MKLLVLLFIFTVSHFINSSYYVAQAADNSSVLSGVVSYSCGWETTILGPGCWLGPQFVDPNRFQRVTNPVRKGNYSVRVEVQPGDDPINSSGERAEVYIMREKSGSLLYENESSGIQFYGLSVLLPTDWKTSAGSGYYDGYWDLIFQLHGPDVLGTSPAFGLELNNDRFSVDMCVGDIARSVNIYDNYRLSDGSLNLGHWVDFVIKIKYAKDANGSVDVWRRNEGVTEFSHVLAVANTPTLQYSSNINGGAVGQHYWKTGFYRNSGTTIDNVLYLDGITRGSTFESVVADAFPFIDGSNYLVWLNHYGRTIDGETHGNFNGDNMVDGLDYVVWSNNLNVPF